MGVMRTNAMAVEASGAISAWGKFCGDATSKQICKILTLRKLRFYTSSKLKIQLLLVATSFRQKISVEGSVVFHMDSLVQ